jgi:hypothetical protein
MLDHMEAVEYVLGKFFQHGDDGFSNARCDEEINRYHDKQAKASSAGRASAERRLKQKSTSVEQKTTDAQLTENQEPITNNQTKNTSAIAPPDGVVESVWADFVELRKSKKAKLTQTALDGITREADKAGWTLENALRECCSRGWTGFKADWVADKTSTRSPPAESFRERDDRLGRERWEEMTGRIHPGNTKNVINITPVELLA